MNCFSLTTIFLSTNLKNYFLLCRRITNPLISSCRHQYMSKSATVKLYLLIVRFVSFRTFNHPIIGSSNPINASGNDFHKYLCSADESGTEGVINGSFCMQRWSLFSCPKSRFRTFSKDYDFADLERPTFHKFPIQIYFDRKWLS